MSTSVTGRFVEKSAKFCPNIAQNGALVNKNFYPEKLPVKTVRTLCKTKSLFTSVGEYWVIYKKMRPDGEFSPNLVTLMHCRYTDAL
jgi:hypothetical protein